MIGSAYGHCYATLTVARSKSNYPIKNIDRLCLLSFFTGKKTA